MPSGKPWTPECSPSHQGLGNGEAIVLVPMDMGFCLSSACPGGTDVPHTGGHLETHVLSHRCLKESTGLQI